MSTRADEIRKRIERRKKERDRSMRTTPNRTFLAEDEERYGHERFPSYEGTPSGDHPLIKKEIVIFKVLASTVLVLLVAILYRNDSPTFDSTKNFVKKSLETEFQFALVSSWYEDTFGKPLALLPTPSTDETKEDPSLVSQQYAVPALGRVMQDFKANGQGVMIETNKDSGVEAMNEGFVIFSGVKEGIGKTVVVQHADKSESWYGQLNEIDVSLYEFIEMGKEVGKVTPASDGIKGSFYFAIKQGEEFIDPIQVIPFE